MMPPKSLINLAPPFFTSTACFVYFYFYFYFYHQPLPRPSYITSKALVAILYYFLFCHGGCDIHIHIHTTDTLYISIYLGTWCKEQLLIMSKEELTRYYDYNLCTLYTHNGKIYQKINISKLPKVYTYNLQMQTSIQITSILGWSHQDSRNIP